MGIPIVNNLKILGHYYGKDKLICDFQNFYCKLSKMEKISNIWYQRCLTIVGENVLINSLINSSFLFNAQIEIPPEDFIKLEEQQNKNFMWGGTPKISHSALIAKFDEGGISYKDLDCFIASINVKFLLYLTSGANNGCSILTQVWINNLFKIPNNFINESQPYFYNFFQKQS